MKYLTAIKLKDGYLVNIVNSQNVGSYSDVLKLIKQEGLKIDQETKEDDEKGNITMVIAN